MVNPQLLEKAICIVLSGSGTEGTLGLREIKGQGGMVMVQDPSTAKYDGMPKSAVGTGLVDYVLPPEKMPEQLVAYIQYPFTKEPGRAPDAEPNATYSLQKILIMIRSFKPCRTLARLHSARGWRRTWTWSGIIT
jgi:two-component system, chemotaxis family, CheB/CheR fusion protein